MQMLQTFPEITRSLLALEQFQFEEFIEAACKKLERLANEFHDEVLSNGKHKSFRTALTFRRYLCTEGFRVLMEPESECFTLCGTLLNNGGSCLGLTTLHIVLGEMAELPLQTVLFEGHIVPVYMDGEIPLYIETTQRSTIMHKHSIQHLHGTPIKFLSTEEFLAVHLSNRASLVYAKAGLMDDAIFLIDSALEIFPDYAAGWINRAVMMQKLENTDEMKRSLDTAKSLNPGYRHKSAIEQIENNNTSTMKIT